MKATEDEVLHQTANSIGGGSSIIKEVDDTRVSKALLKGEITQEVEELRYRTYKVDKEAKTFGKFELIDLIKVLSEVYENAYQTKKAKETIIKGM